MIYLTKGNKRSALIDLRSGEVRTLPNEEIGLDEEEADDFKPEMYLHGVNCFDVEFMDVFPNELPAYHELRTHLQTLPSAFNIRVFIPDQAEFSADEVIRFLKDISKQACHAGLVLIAAGEQLQEAVKEACRWIRVVPMNEGREGPYYHPVFTPMQGVIASAKHHNLFHHSRISVVFENGQLTTRDHQKHDIPKHQIEVCRECEFRDICFDPRVPVKEGSKYRYESDCAYDPFAAAWRE